MNHSCEPNAFVRFDVSPTTDASTLPPYGGISVHALRPIKQDEEVTISYVDTSMPFAKRQEELKARYSFDCTCGLCSRGTDAPLDSFVRDGRIWKGNARIQGIGKQAEKVLLDLQSRASILPMQIDTIKSAMKLLADTKGWPLHHYPYPQLRQELLVGLLSNDMYLEALLHSAILVREIHPVLYEQEYHPSRIIQVYTLFDLSRQCLTRTPATFDPPAENARFFDQMLGRLGCLLIGDMHKLLNGGVAMNGRLEKLVKATHGEVSSRSMPGGAREEYQRDPDAARDNAFDWLDEKVKQMLELEGVAQDIIEMSLLVL